MSRASRDNGPHGQADALLDEWGGNHELIAQGMFPSTQEEGAPEVPPERVDTSGYSDPTPAMVAKRQHLLQIDAAVRAVIPERLRQRLYEQYVERLYQEDAAGRHSLSESAWRAERDDARLIFWNLYHDRRRLARGGTSRGNDQGRPQQVAETVDADRSGC